MLVITAREKTLENAMTCKIKETNENSKNSKNRDKNRDLRINLTQIPCIRYPMTDFSNTNYVGTAQLKK